MSNKTDWQYHEINECWEFEQGKYLLQVFKDEGKPWQWRCIEDHRFCIVSGKPALSLGTAKRMATKWMHNHIANTFGQPAPTDEQAEALNLATELGRLQAMEKQLLTALADAQNQVVLDVLLEIHGEGFPNGD